MFIHLGGDVTIAVTNVIAIIDVRHSKNDVTQEFLNQMEVSGKLYRIEEKDSKSYVITDDCVYISPISAITLKKRAISIDALHSLMP